MLQYLHDIGKTTLEKLANTLECTTEQVEKEMKVLRHAGLALQDKNGKYYAPGDSIIIELPLTLPKTKRFKLKTSSHAN